VSKNQTEGGDLLFQGLAQKKWSFGKIYCPCYYLVSKLSGMMRANDQD